MPVATIIVCVVSACTVWQDENKPVGIDKAKRDLAVLLARKELSSAVRDSVRQVVQSLPNGKNFSDRFLDSEIRRIRTDFVLLDWEPEEREQLFAILAASNEFLALIVEARDVARQRISTKQQGEMKRANDPVAPPKTPPSPPQNMIDSFLEPARIHVAAMDAARFHQDIVNRGRAAFNASALTGNLAKVESDLRASWTQAEKRLQSAVERILPGLLADGHVRDFEAEGLIEDWNRVEIREAPAVNIAECKDPGKLKEVVYTVTDAFGSACRGSVVLYLQSPGNWRTARENETRGGFYELVVIDQNK